jgi:hypothetical protein
MGRVLFSIIFFIFFIIFCVIKFIGQGAKEAYQAVFDPDRADREVKRCLQQVFLLVNQYVEDNYPQKRVPRLVDELIPSVKSVVVSCGYRIEKEQCRGLIMESIKGGRNYAAAAESQR